MEQSKAQINKIPEKWCIRLATEKINDAVNSIRLWNNGDLCWFDHSAYTDYYIGMDGTYDLNLPEKGYIEITFEQFSRWILNIPIDYKPLVFN